MNLLGADVLTWNQVGKRLVRITGSSNIKVVFALEGLFSKLRVSQNWAFRSRLNGFPAGKGAKSRYLLARALESGAEQKVSTSRNESESARANAID